MSRVTFVGADPELMNIYTKLMDVAAKGYSILGYYADEEMKNKPKDVDIKKLGTIKELLSNIKHDKLVDEFGDEIYVCLSRLQRDVIRKVSSYCDQKLVRFYYVPVSVETLGIDLKRELLDDIEIFTTYENPLMNPVNSVPDSDGADIPVRVDYHEDTESGARVLQTAANRPGWQGL